jgi:hypothetical protein
MFVLVATATAAAAAPGRTTLADDTVITAVQQAIQHSNDEQVQAIASRNVSLVTDSVTGDYAQQLTSTLQDMLDHHVTSIALLNLQWGPITVAADGSSAVVTTYETWRVVSTAGTVDDAPTRNEYTVVLDNGTWKIKSDAQTVGAPTPVATDTPAPTPTVPTATPTETPTATPTDAPTPMPADAPTAVPADAPTPDVSED